MSTKFWGLPKAYLLSLVKEANKDLIAVQNRLRRFETEEMDEVSLFISNRANRRFILKQ